MYHIMFVYLTYCIYTFPAKYCDCPSVRLSVRELFESADNHTIIWATVYKMVRHMLSDRCVSVLSVLPNVGVL